MLKLKTIVLSKKFYKSELSQVVQLNRQLLLINDAVKEYSRFWSPYLTIAMPSLVIIFTYQLYFLTYDNDIPLLLKYFFVLTVSQLVLSLYLLIRECAQVVKLNGICLIENRKFYLKYIQCQKNLYASNLLKVMTTRKIPQIIIIKNFFVQMESLLESRRFKVYGFTLMFGYRITSKTFHTVCITLIICF